MLEKTRLWVLIAVPPSKDGAGHTLTARAAWRNMMEPITPHCRANVMPRRAEVADLSLPEFGPPGATPVIPKQLYAARLDRLRQLGHRACSEVVAFARPEAGFGPVCE
jgi:hypothetical protein